MQRYNPSHTTNLLIRYSHLKMTSFSQWWLVKRMCIVLKKREHTSSSHFSLFLHTLSTFSCQFIEWRSVSTVFTCIERHFRYTAKYRATYTSQLFFGTVWCSFVLITRARGPSQNELSYYSEAKFLEHVVPNTLCKIEDLLLSLQRDFCVSATLDLDTLTSNIVPGTKF